MPPKRIGAPLAKGKAKAKAHAKALAKAKAGARAKAAARAAAKARAVAAAKAGAGGGRRGRRRPAAKEEEAGKAASKVNVGDVVGGSLEGTYWEGTFTPTGQYIEFEVRGTSSDNLLKYLSGIDPKRIDVHVCKEPCEHKVWKDGLFHLTKSSLVGSGVEDWMSNVVAVPRREEGDEDELAQLRKEAAEARGRSRDRKRRSKTRSKKRSRTRSKKRKREKSEEKREEKEAKRKSAKIRAKKSVEQVLGSTGLDPDPSLRRRFLRRAQRLAQGKKKKKSKEKKKDKASSCSQRGSEGSSSSSTSSHDGQGVEREELFGATTSAKQIAQKLPGVLTASWLRDAQDYLVTSQGQIWNQEEKEVQPLAVQYFRQQARPRMGGAMSREYHTLATMVDLTILGRVAELTDVGTQRMKSLLAAASGVHFTVAQKMEVLPPEKVAAASLQETQEAARQAREEEKTMAKAAKRPTWGNPPADQGKGGKGKDGKGKKGKNKDGKGRDGDKGGSGEAKRS